jgi:hypothetical protein
MRADSFAGQVLAVFSRRASAFQPLPDEPSSFAGAIFYLSRPDVDAKGDHHLKKRWIPVLAKKFILGLLVGSAVSFGIFTAIIGNENPWWSVAAATGLVGLVGPIAAFLVTIHPEDASSNEQAHDQEHPPDDASTS